MEYDIYCDESRPDLFSSGEALVSYMLIGSLWLEKAKRNEFKTAIHQLRDKHKVGGEFKWQKVSPSRLNFYLDLIDWFFGVGPDLRFRCIAIDYKQVDLIHYHDNDQELGFYKFYYQMLHHWILDFNTYYVFCDYKRNRSDDRLKVLHDCLQWSNLSSDIANIQSVRSKKSVLIQLCDTLIGGASSRLNNTLRTGSAKESVVNKIEEHLGRIISHTVRGEQKFNVFVIDLHGGW